MTSRRITRGLAVRQRAGRDQGDEMARRRTMTSVALGVLVAGGLVLGGALPAAAGTPDLKAKFAKKPDGPFVDDELQVSVNAPGKRVLYMKLKNTADAGIGSFTDGAAPPPGWSKQWFKNFTGHKQTSSDGFERQFSAGEVKRFRVRIKRDQLSSAEGCVTIAAEDEEGDIDLAYVGLNRPAL